MLCNHLLNGKMYLAANQHKQIENNRGNVYCKFELCKQLLIEYMLCFTQNRISVLSQIFLKIDVKEKTVYIFLHITGYIMECYNSYLEGQ